MSIFIAIASYCDPVLPLTLTSAYEKAKYPDQLRFGIVDQSPKNASYPVPTQIPSAQLSYVYIEAAQSRGCCWARNLVMSLYRDEDYYFQVDSHTLFAQDWDDILVRKMKACLQYSAKAVISSYPPAFRLVDGVATPDESDNLVRASVVSPGASFQPKHPCFIFKAIKIPNVGALQGYHISAGCLFAPGRVVFSIPYDPYLYFNEEEQNISLRLYTHGWDIYHVAGVPIYHLYNPEPEKVVVDRRPLHWDTTAEPGEKPPWWSQVRRARKRMATLVWGNSKQLGVYGLGRERSLQDYAEMCGIDYPHRTITQKAFDGPWELQGSGAENPAATRY
jgi:Glycosyltransferase (GlcNAc)